MGATGQLLGSLIEDLKLQYAAQRRALYSEPYCDMDNKGTPGQRVHTDLQS